MHLNMIILLLIMMHSISVKRVSLLMKCSIYCVCVVCVLNKS